MPDMTEFNNLANKLVNIEDKITDIEQIAKMLDIWSKEKDYELIPLINMLNNKINDTMEIIKK